MSEKKPLTTEEKLAYPVDALVLSVRASNVLRNKGIKTVGELAKSDARELLQAQNCGKKTLQEFIACLKLAGLQMLNCDGLYSDEEIDEEVAGIRRFLAARHEPTPKVEMYSDKRSKEIRQRQITVMQMRVEGATFAAIGEKVGRTKQTASVYFSRMGRWLVREAKKRGVPVEAVLTENNIPLAVIDLMRKDGVQFS
jgi:RNA polymerase alpha subunit